MMKKIFVLAVPTYAIRNSSKYVFAYEVTFEILGPKMTSADFILFILRHKIKDIGRKLYSIFRRVICDSKNTLKLILHNVPFVYRVIQ